MFLAIRLALIVIINLIFNLIFRTMKTVKELICVCQANFENRKQPECLSRLLQEICGGKHSFEFDDIIELGALLVRWKKYQHKLWLDENSAGTDNNAALLDEAHERLLKIVNDAPEVYFYRLEFLWQFNYHQSASWPIKRKVALFAALMAPVTDGVYVWDKYVVFFKNLFLSKISLHSSFLTSEDFKENLEAIQPKMMAEDWLMIFRDWKQWRIQLSQSSRLLQDFPEAQLMETSEGLALKSDFIKKMKEVMDEHDVAMICALGRRLMGNAFLFPQRLRDLFDFSEFLALTEGVGQPEFEQLHSEIKAFARTYCQKTVRCM